MKPCKKEWYYRLNIYGYASFSLRFGDHTRVWLSYIIYSIGLADTTYMGFFIFFLCYRTYSTTINLNSSSCPIHFLEHVLVRVNLKVWPRGDLRLSLEAPSTTKSRLTQDRPYDRFRSVSRNLTDWVILSVHHWGENPVGNWTLRADGNYRKQQIFVFIFLRLILRAFKEMQISSPAPRHP